MIHVTEKQWLVFKFIREFQYKNRVSPTKREIAIKFNVFHSYIDKVINALKKKGLIETDDKSRILFPAIPLIYLSPNQITGNKNLSENVKFAEEIKNFKFPVPNAAMPVEVHKGYPGTTSKVGDIKLQDGTKATVLGSVSSVTNSGTTKEKLYSGKHSPRRKSLTREDVLKIRELKGMGYGVAQISRLLDISQSSCGSVYNNINYTDIR